MPDSDLGAPLATASAPGKIILFGEHAVVYGQPALAIPVSGVAARATVWPSERPLSISARRPDAGADEPVDVTVRDAPSDHALATAVRGALARAGQDSSVTPEWLVEIVSSVPVGSGMGSSAAVAVAAARAVGRAAGVDLDDDTVSAIAFEAEMCTHGTPSGIDNTVVALARAIRFQAGQGDPVSVRVPLTFLVADSGEAGPTGEQVAAVRARRAEQPRIYDHWFAQIGGIVDRSVAALASGELVELGWLLDRNHLILQALRTSTPRLDTLVASARHAGALGAKLSGAGGGGVVVALAGPDGAGAVAEALRDAGAVTVIETVLEATVLEATAP